MGRAVLRVAAERKLTAIAASHADLPVENADAVTQFMQSHSPDFVLHCGAWTDVDGCERDPQRADLINGSGTANLASACAQTGSGLLYVSTDFVFDGSNTEPYDVADPTCPVSAYGASKLRGEEAVLTQDRDNFYIARTAWVFGPGGRNFPRAILERARSGGPLKVVDDQVGSPSMTLDLAQALLDLAASKAEAGIYHVANEGQCSWHQFAFEILQAAGIDVPIGTMKSDELDRPAKRPAYSVLDCSRLAKVRGQRLPDYQDALRRYLREESSE